MRRGRAPDESFYARPVWLLLGIPGLCLFLVVVAALVGQSIKVRTGLLEKVAATNGLAFTATHPAPDAYARYGLFGKGRGRVISNVMTGRRSGTDVEVFDYHYATGGSGNSRRDFQFTVVSLLLERPRPHLLVQKGSIFGSLGRHDGDVDAAAALLTPDVRAVLDQLDKGGIEIRDRIVVWAKRRPPDRQLDVLNMAERVRDALPPDDPGSV